jgi:hypothetical protein
MKTNIESVKINPLRAASILFLVISPFLTWITIVSVVVYKGAAIFGTAAQSDLLMISSQQLGTNITASAALGAGISIVAIFLGGIVMIRSIKLGAIVSALGLMAYLIPFYSIFGLSTYGFEFTYISPGIGLFTATAGLIFGLASSKVKSGPPRELIQALQTRRGLSVLGASIGIVGITLDVVNHYALGQISEFVGAGPVEETLRLGLIAAMVSIFAIVRIGGRLQGSPLFALSLSTLGLLGIDFVLSYSSGDLNEFLGHNLTENILHLSVYYGVALTLISGFLRKD